MGYYPENNEEFKEALIAWTNSRARLMGIDPFSRHDMARVYCVNRRGEVSRPFFDVDRFFDDDITEEEQAARDREALESNFNEAYFQKNRLYVFPIGAGEPLRIRAERQNGALVFTAEKVTEAEKELFDSNGIASRQADDDYRQMIHDADAVLLRQDRDLEAYRELFGAPAKDGERKTRTFAEKLAGDRQPVIPPETLAAHHMTEDDLAALSAIVLFSQQSAQGSEQEKRKAVLGAPKLLEDLAEQRAEDPEAYAKRIRDARNLMGEMLKDPVRFTNVLAEGIVNYAGIMRRSSSLAAVLPGLKLAEFLERAPDLQKTLGRNAQVQTALQAIRARNAAYHLERDRMQAVRAIANREVTDLSRGRQMLAGIIGADVLNRTFAAVRAGADRKAAAELEKAFADPKKLAAMRQAVMKNTNITHTLGGMLNYEYIRMYLNSPDYGKLVEKASGTMQAELKNVIRGKILPEFEVEEERVGIVRENFTTVGEIRAGKVKKEEPPRPEPNDGLGTIREVDEEEDAFFDERDGDNDRILIDTGNQEEIDADEDDEEEIRINEVLEPQAPAGVPAEDALSKEAQDRLQVSRKAEKYLDFANRFLNKNRELKAAFHDFRKETRTLITLIDQYDRRDENGRTHMLTGEELDTLKGQFSALQEKAAVLLQFSREKGLGENTGFYRSIETVNRMFSKDLKTCGLLRADGKASLRTLLNAAQTEVIDISGIRQKSVGKNMSTRIPVSVQREEDGETRLVKGMFTPERTANAYSNFYSLALEYKGDADCMQAIGEIDNICRAEHIDVTMLFGSMEDKDSGILRVDPRCQTERINEWFYEHITAEHNMKLIEFAHRACSQIRSDMQQNANGIGYDRNVEQRNCAMSAVADLLGMNELIAKAVPMTVWDGHKYSRGCFMEFGKGVDINNVSPADREGMKKVNGISSDALVSASDLQVLDFICGNFDRHGANVFYRYKGKSITGVQGIDNDSAFVDLPDEVLTGEQEYQHFVGLNKMGFIEKETAKKVLNLKTETLAAVLSHYRLSKKEINAACRRLKKIQKGMNAQYLKRNADPDKRIELDENLYILDRKQIGRIDQETLAARDDTEIHNIYRYLNEFFMESDHLRSRKTEEPGEAKTESAAPHLSLTKYCDKMQEFLQSLTTENKGYFIGSQEYRNVLSYLKVMNTELVRLRVNPPENENEERLRISSMFIAMNDLTTAYLDKKETDGSLDKSETARKRTIAVQQLKDFTENNVKKLGVSGSDRYCQMTAQERRACYRHDRDAGTIRDRIAAVAGSLARRETISPEDFRLQDIFTEISDRSRNVIIQDRQAGKGPQVLS